MENKEKIRQFFGDQLKDNSIQDDDSLLMSGVIDSVRMVDLIEYLEEAFNIAIEEEEMMPDNFDSVNAIASFVQVKLDS